MNQNNNSNNDITAMLEDAAPFADMTRKALNQVGIPALKKTMVGFLLARMGIEENLKENNDDMDRAAAHQMALELRKFLATQKNQDMSVVLSALAATGAGLLGTTLILAKREREQGSDIASQIRNMLRQQGMDV